MAIASASDPGENSSSSPHLGRCFSSEKGFPSQRVWLSIQLHLFLSAPRQASLLQCCRVHQGGAPRTSVPLSLLLSLCDPCLLCRCSLEPQPSLTRRSCSAQRCRLGCPWEEVGSTFLPYNLGPTCSVSLNTHVDLFTSTMSTLKKKSQLFSWQMGLFGSGRAIATQGKQVWQKHR